MNKKTIKLWLHLLRKDYQQVTVKDYDTVTNVSKLKEEGKYSAICLLEEIMNGGNVFAILGEKNIIEIMKMENTGKSFEEIADYIEKNIME